MANAVQNTTSTSNPLFDKMCDRFQFQGHVAVAEVMLKKAERLHGRTPRIAKPMAEKKAMNVSFSPSFARQASICCSILLLVSVLMLCAIFGTSANGEFSKATGVFADAENAEVAEAENGKVDMVVYTHDTPELAVKTELAVGAEN